MACKLRQYLLTKSNLSTAYQRQSSSVGKCTSKSTSTNLLARLLHTGNYITTISQLENAPCNEISPRDVTRNGLKKYYCILPASLKRRYLRFSTIKLSPPPCQNEHSDTLAYEKVAEHTLDTLSDIMDELICQHADQIDTDVSLNSGVLTVNLGPHGTYVINKQTPNRQIWLSSPKSGPWRFDLVNGDHWVSTKGGQHLDQLLSNEFSGIFKDKVTVSIDLKNR